MVPPHLNLTSCIDALLHSPCVANDEWAHADIYVTRKRRPSCLRWCTQSTAAVAARIVPHVLLPRLPSSGSTSPVTVPLPVSLRYHSSHFSRLSSSQPISKHDFHLENGATVTVVHLDALLCVRALFERPALKGTPPVDVPRPRLMYHVHSPALLTWSHW